MSVVQLCKGSFMFLEGEFFEQSCANEFAFNMGIVTAAVWHLTGMVGVELVSKKNTEIGTMRLLCGLP